MKNVASADQELTVEERNLLSVAYKNVIGARRASWRIVTSIEQKEESKGNESQVALIKEYRQKIEAELAKICEDILEVLDRHLIPSAQSGESKVFYHKMYVSSFVPYFPPFGIDEHVGRVTTTVTWPSSLLVINARSRLISLWRLTRTQLRLLKLILLPLTLSVWGWHSTFQCSTTRSLTPLTRHVIWPSRLSTTRSQVGLVKYWLCLMISVLILPIRARHPERGELQGFHPHHAVAARQLGSLD